MSHGSTRSAARMSPARSKRLAEAAAFLLPLAMIVSQFNLQKPVELLQGNVGDPWTTVTIYRMAESSAS